MQICNSSSPSKAHLGGFYDPFFCHLKERMKTKGITKLHFFPASLQSVQPKAVRRASKPSLLELDHHFKIPWVTFTSHNQIAAQLLSHTMGK